MFESNGHTQQVAIPGPRDVRGSLESPTQSDTGPSDADELATDSDSRTASDGVDAIVVACPPHPEHGGDRHDRRLVAVSEALRDHDIACLRIDYGPWDEGHGERRDVGAALSWASQRYDRLGCFGYSFGAALAVLASAEHGADAVAALAPPSTLGPDLDVLGGLERLEAPTLVAYGFRDRTVDWEPVAECARKEGHRLLEWPADHHFVGQHGDVAADVASFFGDTIG